MIPRRDGTALDQWKISALGLEMVKGRNHLVWIHQSGAKEDHGWESSMDPRQRNYQSGGFVLENQVVVDCEHADGRFSVSH